MGSQEAYSAPARARAGWEGLLGALVLVISAVLGISWLRARLMEIDEYLSFYTDSRPTVAAVLRVQLHWPISLDPPVYHLLSHLAMKILGPGAAGLRAPALAGYLLFQWTLYVFVRRIAGVRAAVLAAALPLSTATFYYAVEGRPYGLLLGLYGLALVCWQAAARPGGSRSRMWPLIGLAAALILAVNAHFFGALVLVPICAGEFARTLRRRRLDWAVLGVIGLGTASLAAVVPFQRAAVVYRLHYYSTLVTWRVALQAYPAFFYPHHTLPLPQQHVFLAALGTAEALVLFGLGVQWVRRWRELTPELVALAALFLLPVLAVVIGKLVTHTTDVRYVLPALFANAAFFAIALAPLLRNRVVFVLLLGLLVGFGTHLILTDVHASQAAKNSIGDRFYQVPAVAAALAQDPARPIYIQSLGDFYMDAYYAPDAAVRRRLALVYSQPAELGWLGHDTNYLTARNMEHFAPLTVAPYSQLLGGSATALVVQHRDGWDWLSRDLGARHIPERVIGPFMNGELVELELNQVPPADRIAP